MGYKKLCLIQLPHADRGSNSVFPLGLGYVGMVAKNEGIDVTLFDIHRYALNKQQVIDKIKNMNCDIIGINAYSTQYAYYKWLVDIIDNTLPDALIITGGPLATNNAKQVLENTNTDICVIGEGEETVKEIINSKYNEYKQIAGIAYMGEQGVVFTSSRPLIRDIDDIPFIDYEVFPLDDYIGNAGLFGYPARRVMNMVSSRGCPANCNFCSKVFPKARRRSINNIYNEIYALKKKYNIDGISFIDELVITGKKRTLELCAVMKELNIKWGCQCRVSYAPLELFKKMKKSGCVYVGLGVESGSQKILDNMNKRTTVEKNEAAIKNVIAAGLTPVVQMIYGYPGEDESTIDETVDMFKRAHYFPPNVFCKPHMSLITPLPGSKLYNDCVSNGRIKNEVEYLLKLEQGYISSSPVLINFTTFSDKELMERKEMVEKAIFENYMRYLKENLLARVSYHILFLKVRFLRLKIDLIKDIEDDGISTALNNFLKKIFSKIVTQFDR